MNQLSQATNPVVVEVTRGELVECVHRARVVVTGPDGEVVFSAGEVDAPFYSRSSLKPVQALAMLRLGLDLTGAELALAAASHSGELFHLQRVQSMLTRCGLTESDLRNTPDLPLGRPAMEAWLAAGHGPTALAQNCSGKHAAMLRTCQLADFTMDDYLHPEHPLQVAIADTVVEYTGSASPASVDGCGAPLFATPMAGLARTFGRFAAASSGHEQAIADAYRQFPEFASGTGRADLDFHRAVPGLICKVGAEACFAVGLADGTGVVAKIDDGNNRALKPLVAAILQSLGHGGLDHLATEPVLGHGEPVGEVRIAPAFQAQLARANW